VQKYTQFYKLFWAMEPQESPAWRGMILREQYVLEHVNDFLREGIDRNVRLRR
jgi:hypothetical protein